MSPSASRRSGLPSLLLGVLYTLLVLLPLLLSLAADGGHRLALTRLAAAAGMAAAAMILLQMVSSGRFEAISGRIGIDVTMAFHKWAAPVALLLAVAHLLFLVGPPDAAHPGRFSRRLSVLLSGDGLLDARLALALLAVLVLLALFRDRLPVRYEVWRASHGLVALALLALMLWHIIGDGRGGLLSDATWLALALAVTLPALGVYARRLTAPKTACWRVAGRRKVAERLWEVTLENPAGQRLDFRPGQFAWAAFGGQRLPLYDHPFSIASGPGEAALRFLIQEAGDFTRTIGALTPGTRVALDAPHGSFGLRPDGDGGILLIAGGVGVAPILSVLTALARTGCRRPVRLIYAARAPRAMLPEGFYRPACEALGITPLLLADHDAAAAGLETGPLSQTHLKLALAGLDPARCDALICGPGPMMTMATDALARLGVPLARIDYERFVYDTGDLSRKDRRMLAGFALMGAAIAAAIGLYSFA